MENSQPAEALEYFEKALTMRRELPLEHDPLLRFGLAACWLNRGDALMRLGDRDRISVALHSYDQGIAVMEKAALSSDPRFPRRLAIAHQNRGLALLAAGGSLAADAAAAFRNALQVLNGEDSASVPDLSLLRATVWMNLSIAQAGEGRESARRAIALVAPAEETSAEAAEVGLKARHVLCQISATHLSAGTQQDAMPDAVHEATDAVDDGLNLAGLWEQRGITRFRELAYDLFRFGARVYAAYQPQFLEEFVRDNLDAGKSSVEYVMSTGMQTAAEEALLLAMRK